MEEKDREAPWKSQAAQKDGNARPRDVRKQRTELLSHGRERWWRRGGGRGRPPSLCGRCSVPIQHHLSALPLSTPPHLPSPRTMSGHSKVSSNLAGLTTLLHLPTDSKLTPKSISKECKEKTDKNRKSYQEDKRPLGRSQGRLGLQFTNPGTLQLLKDLLIAPMVTGRIASSLSTEPLGTPPPPARNYLPLCRQQ